jgi:hypothetical protein
LITCWTAEPGLPGGIVITSLLPGTENVPLPVLIGIAVVILIVLAILVLKRHRGGGRTVYNEEQQDFDYQTAIGHVPSHAPVRASPPKPAPVVKKAAPAPQASVSVLDGCNDITGCLNVLVRKFSLESFTLATCDGLVFASSAGGNAPADAARYSEIFCNDPLSETPGVVLFGLDHSGSSLVGIIRTQQDISREIQGAIESDTKVILNRWI